MQAFAWRTNLEAWVRLSGEVLALLWASNVRTIRSERKGASERHVRVRIGPFVSTYAKCGGGGACIRTYVYTYITLKAKVFVCRLTNMQLETDLLAGLRGFRISYHHRCCGRARSRVSLHSSVLISQLRCCMQARLTYILAAFELIRIATCTTVFNLDRQKIK